jgi:hypothetical protein
VFLPGFKANKMVNMPLTAGTWTGGTVWGAPLRYPALSKTPISTATAWMSFDGRLLQLAGELHEPRGSASGLIMQEGCAGPPVVPLKAPG